MPINGFELAVGVAIMIGLPVAVIALNRWKATAGWWLLGGAIAFVVIGNVIERLIG